MAVKTWQPIKIKYCDHVGMEVALEAEVLYPADMIPNEDPRVVGHRCSQGISCNLDGRASCIWAGTNPAFDPFKE